MTILLDYSSARPSTATMRDAGAVGVIRYLTHGTTNPKRLTKAEADQLRAAGFLIGLVFEDGAGRAVEGSAVGLSDMQFCATAAAKLGAPATLPIFLAVDQDLDPARVLPYFRGALAARTSNPVGVYGSYRVVEAVMAAGVPYGWQTVAWSHGQRSSRAHLLQTAERSVPDTDKNYLLKPLPLWGAQTPPKPKPTPDPPKPTPMPAPLKETEMVIVYVPNGVTALLAGGKLVSLTSNAQVDSYKRAGVPVERVTQADMDTYAAVSAKL